MPPHLLTASLLLCACLLVGTGYVGPAIAIAVACLPLMGWMTDAEPPPRCKRASQLHLWYFGGQRR